MFHVHPDVFSMNDHRRDLATAMTTRLIEIYQSEDLATLKVCHSHLFIHDVLTSMSLTGLVNVHLTNSSDFLIEQKKKLEEDLIKAKRRHTYQVLTTYNKPNVLFGKLKASYNLTVSLFRGPLKTHLWWSRVGYSSSK